MTALISNSDKNNALVGSVSLPNISRHSQLIPDISREYGPLPSVHGNGVINEFDTRLEDIINLIEDGLLTHEIICRILKQLLAMSGYNQIQSLWTSLQPLLHRDYMFTGQLVEPDMNFQPVSTALSREIRSHLTKTRNITRYHRARSAYLTGEEEVLDMNRLPPILSSRRGIIEGGNGERTTDIWPASNTGEGTRTEEKIVRNLLERKIHFSSPLKKRVKFPADKTAPVRDTKIRKRLKILGDHKRREIREKVENLFVWFEEWTSPERAAFFRAVLPKLEMKQLYFLSTYLSIRQHCDFVSKLPVDCSLKILSYLSAKDLARSAMVSKIWHKLCLSGALWREKCDEIRSEMATPSVSSTSARSVRHYEIYRGDHLRQRNWSRARCSCAYFRGHDAKVLSVAFNKKILVSGSADATVRVWSIRNGATLKVLTGHSKGVWCVAIFTDVLVLSGSYDHSLKLWNIFSGVCLRTLFGHIGAVWALSCKNSMVATASHDTTVKLWDMSHCKLKCTFEGHSKPVFAVDMSDDSSTVFSGAADHSVRIWNAAQGRCVKVIWSTNSAPIMSVSYAEGFLAFSAHKLLFVWDVKAGKYVKNYRGHKCRIEATKMIVKSRDGKKQISLLSAGKDGKLKHWRFGQSKPVNVISVHKGCQINCIAFDKKRLVTALYDNSISICDFTMNDDLKKHVRIS